MFHSKLFGASYSFFPIYEEMHVQKWVENKMFQILKL